MFLGCSFYSFCLEDCFFLKTISKTHFFSDDYLELIKSCPDGVLVVNLCRPYYEMPELQYEVASSEVLPLRWVASCNYG